MQEIGNLMEQLGAPLGILFMLMAFGLTVGAFAVSIPRLLHRENHHFA